MKIEHLNPLLEIAEEITSVPLEQLLTNYKSQDKSGTRISLQQARKPMEAIRDVLSRIVPEALETLPERRLNEFGQALMTLLDGVKQLHEFTFERNQTLDEATKALGQFYSDRVDYNYSKFLDIVWCIIVESLSLYNAQTTTLNVQLTQIRDAIDEAIAAKEKIDNILVAAQEEIQESTASKHSIIFSGQADIHGKSAKSWKYASIVLIIILMVGLFTSFWYILKIPNELRVVAGVGSFLIVSLVSYCIVLTVRSYFSEKHNETINRHKANCLSSYNTFIEGASEEVRNTILQYTTQTIFSPYNPGYLNKDTMQSPSPILEIVRSISPNGAPLVK